MTAPLRTLPRQSIADLRAKIDSPERAALYRRARQSYYEGMLAQEGCDTDQRMAGIVAVVDAVLAATVRTDFEEAKKHHMVAILVRGKKVEGIGRITNEWYTGYWAAGNFWSVINNAGGEKHDDASNFVAWLALPDEFAGVDEIADPKAA